MRKLKYYLQLEEERQRKLQEEEDARRHEEAEKRRKEKADWKAKLDEIAEKQRQRERELEEKERLRKEALLGRITETLSRPSEPPDAAHPLEPGSAVSAAASAASAAPLPGRYVPKFKREQAESSGQAPPPESDQSGSRQGDRVSQTSERWRSDDRRSSFSGSGSSRSSSTGSSSRIPPRGSER